MTVSRAARQDSRPPPLFFGPPLRPLRPFAVSLHRTGDRALIAFAGATSACPIRSVYSPVAIVDSMRRRLQVLPVTGRPRFRYRSRSALMPDTPSPTPTPRTGQPDPSLERDEFERRCRLQFTDPAFDAQRDAIDRLAAHALDACKAGGCVS